MSDLLKSNGDLIKQISDTLDYAKLENLSEAEIKKIASAVMVDQLKEELSDRVKAARVNIAERIENFLSEYRAENTRKIYQTSLNHLIGYLEGKGINTLFVKTREADGYLRYLDGCTLSNSSKRLYIGAISSFYSHLERWEDVDRNPFRGAKRPKKEFAEKPVPSKKEIKTMITELKNNLQSEGQGAYNRIKCSKMLLPALHFMSEYGLRAGALQKIEIQKDRTYISVSKGKPISGNLQQETILLLKDLGKRPFEGLGESTVRGAMSNFTKRLKKQGKIKSDYSPHSLRHYFAVLHYRESGNDIYSTMQALNHASLAVTEQYLRSLGIDPRVASEN